jgi:hypothetical protein
MKKRYQLMAAALLAWIGLWRITQALLISGIPSAIESLVPTNPELQPLAIAVWFTAVGAITSFLWQAKAIMAVLEAAESYVVVCRAGRNQHYRLMAWFNNRTADCGAFVNALDYYFLARLAHIRLSANNLGEAFWKMECSCFNRVYISNGSYMLSSTYLT